MTTFAITITKKGLTQKALQKMADKALVGFDGGYSVDKKPAPATSRADRFGEAKDEASNAKSAAEELRYELQSWFDNLPEQFQSGDKGQALEEAIQNLDEFIEALDTADGVEVDFPGMY